MPDTVINLGVPRPPREASMPDHDEWLEDAVPTTLASMPGVRGLTLSRRAMRREQRATERALVALSIRRATTASERQLLLGHAGIAAVILVPTLAWVAPVTRILRECAGWHHILEGTAPLKVRSGDDTERRISNLLSAGGRVIGVAPDLGWLPRSLASAADLNITIRLPDARVLNCVIAAVVEDKQPPCLEPPNAFGLDFADIVAAIRKHSTPAECCARLSAARASRTAATGGSDDVPALSGLHGYGDAMAWANDLVAGIRSWRADRASFPQGLARAVLAGPPGTGKTLLVRSLARELDVPLVATSVGSWFTSAGYLDSVIKTIDAVFEQARASGCAVILIDEMDAIPNRATLSDRDRTWWTTIVTFLLTKLDGAHSDAARNVVIVGATNHARHLDEALVRPGRLERVIDVQPPATPEARVAILRSHLRGELADVDLAAVGALTAGRTGADLMALVRDARRKARLGDRAVTVADLVSIACPATERLDEEDQRYAVHECGHVVMALAQGFEIGFASLLDTKDTAGGVTLANKSSVLTRADCEREVVVLLAGMAAEELLLGHRSTGAGGPSFSDLGRATELLTALHTVHGMGNRLFYAPWEVFPDPRIVAEVERDLQRLWATTKESLSGHRESIRVLVEALRASRVLTGKDIAIRLQCLKGGSVSDAIPP